MFRSPPRFFACLNELRLGSALIWRLHGRGRGALSLLSPVSAVGILVEGNRREFMVGCPLTSAAVHSCVVDLGRWCQPHLAVGAYFDCQRWTWRVTQPTQRARLWPARWLSAVVLKWGF